MSSPSFNLVYFLHSACSFQNGQNDCLFSVTCGRAVLIAFHTFFIEFFLEILKYKDFTKCQKKIVFFTTANVLFSASTQDCKVQLHPLPIKVEQKLEGVLITLFLLLLHLYSHCSLTVLHSFPLHQPPLNLIPPSKSFFINTMLSPSLLDLPGPYSPASLDNLSSTVHCLRVCFDLMLTCVSVGQNCGCLFLFADLKMWKNWHIIEIYWTWFRKPKFNS